MYLFNSSVRIDSFRHAWCLSYIIYQDTKRTRSCGQSRRCRPEALGARFVDLLAGESTRLSTSSSSWPTRRFMRVPMFYVCVIPSPRGSRATTYFTICHLPICSSWISRPPFLSSLNLISPATNFYVLALRKRLLRFLFPIFVRKWSSLLLSSCRC